MTMEIRRIIGRDRAILSGLKGWFSRNIGLKLISLALGLFLWFHAVTDQSHQMEYPVPLQIVVADSSLMIVNDPPRKVDILFAGPGKELLKLWWKPPRFTKEVTATQAGVVDLSLDVSSLTLPPNVNIIPLGIRSPTSLHLALDRVIEKEVAVRSRLRVIPGEQYVVVGDIAVDPGAVTLKGARGELSGLDSVVTAEGVVEGVVDSFSTTLPLDLSGFRTVTSPVREVRLSGRVEKYVDIELGGIPISLRGRLRDRFVLQPAFIELVVVGPVSRIRSLRREEIEVFIEINDPPVGETYYSPMIELPDGIELLSEQPKLFKAVPVSDAGGNSVEDLTRAAPPLSVLPRQ
jgi:hypothetical protein